MKRDVLRSIPFFACRQSEHGSILRELAHMQLCSHANAPTTERYCREGAQGPGALDMHRPKRSVDGQSAKHRLHVIPNKPTSRMLRIPLVANANIRN